MVDAIYRGGSDPANNSDRSLSSPPTSSGRSGRGRGRTRGRGSVRLSAQDSRVGQIKSEHHHAESDVAMLDTKHEQIKQEGGDADQQPAVSVKAEDSNAQQEPSQAAAGQSVSHQIALSTAETQQDEQPVLSSPAQSNKLQQSGVPSSAQEQLSSPKGDPQQSVQPPSHVPNLQSLSSAGGLSLPRTSLEMLPEEDDYDADE